MILRWTWFAATGNPTRTALIGHRSDANTNPCIVIGMVTPDEWPGVHMKRHDPDAGRFIGRCGFVMASGEIRSMFYGEANNDENIELLFHPYR